MFNSFKHHLVGEPLPNDAHAVSCSLPTMDDIIGYEEKKTSTMQSLKAGYPRFTRHKYISDIIKTIAHECNVDNESIFLIASLDIIPLLEKFIINESEVDLKDLEILKHKALHIVFTKNYLLKDIIRRFLQHTGGSITSRQAEDYLLGRNTTENCSTPSLSKPIATIKEVLASKHRASSLNDIYLGRSGMSCFFAAYLSLTQIQSKKGKTVWIQLGWLYIDTIEILKSYAKEATDYIYFPNVLDLQTVEEYITINHLNIAGIVTESPTNPLIQTMDVERLYKFSRKFDIAVVLDPTIASPHNVRCLEFSDITINSLTKYSAHKGNIMMGSLVLNPKSPYYQQTQNNIDSYLIQPYSKDLIELSKQIVNYDTIVEKMNANNIELVKFLENHPAVKKVYHAYSKEYATYYKKIAWKKDSPGCLISIELKIPIKDFYDNIKIAKGPSLGQEFTIICPFIYLAHYDLVSTLDGKKTLEKNHMPVDLIRISVGIEDPKSIIKSFKDALT